MRKLHIRDSFRVLTGRGLPYVGYEVLGTGASSVSRRGAEFSLDYVACELAKARPVSALPVHVYEHGGGARQEATERGAVALSRLLRGYWNPFAKSAEGIRWLMMTRDTMPAAYVRVEWQGGVPVALWPVTSNVTPGRFDDGSAAFMCDGDDFTPRGTYMRHEMLVFKSPLAINGGVGARSLAEAAAANIGLSVDLEAFYSRLLNNGNHFPGYLQSEQKLSKDDKEEIADSLKGSTGVLAAGKLRIFDQGLKYQTVPLTMGDISLVEQQTWVLEQMCRVLGVPPQEVYDLSHATYSNVEQGAIQFAQKTLMPEVREIETSFQPVFDALGLPDCYVRFDLNGLLRGTYSERMEGYRTAVYAGWMTRNEVRAMEEMAPLDGLDEPLQPTAYYGLDQNGRPVEPSNTSSAIASNVALAPVHDDMRARVRDRFASDGDTDRSRDFAAKVLRPYSDACLLAGVDYDMQTEIEELANG